MSLKFKSEEPFFTKEYQDIKNNTVRKLSSFAEDDERLEILRKFPNNYVDEEDFLEICIEEKYPYSSYPNYFYRKVKDVSFFDDLVVITWESKQIENDQELSHILDDDFFNDIYRKVGFLRRVLGYKDFNIKVFKRNDLYFFKYHGVTINFTNLIIDEDFYYIKFTCGKGVSSSLFIYDFIPADKNPKDLIV